jgi:hypothetical protein
MRRSEYLQRADYSIWTFFGFIHFFLRRSCLPLFNSSEEPSPRLQLKFLTGL